uniref:Uncharacterized protein n=1 Tax=Oryza punctata TaxID=4537 RepID=A0A0E0MMP2_ORYPU
MRVKTFVTNKTYVVAVEPTALPGAVFAVNNQSTSGRGTMRSISDPRKRSKQAKPKDMRASTTVKMRMEGTHRWRQRQPPSNGSGGDSHPSGSDDPSLPPRSRRRRGVGSGSHLKVNLYKNS